MIYTHRLQNGNELEVGKTYYKDKRLTFPLANLLNIKILSKSGGNVTATIGKDTFVQTMTEDEAMLYINAQGGYGE